MGSRHASTADFDSWVLDQLTQVKYIFDECK